VQETVVFVIQVITPLYLGKGGEKEACLSLQKENLLAAQGSGSASLKICKFSTGPNVFCSFLYECANKGLLYLDLCSDNLLLNLSLIVYNIHVEPHDGTDITETKSFITLFYTMLVG
jgi:hypothetical protein